MPIFQRQSRGVANQYRGNDVSVMIPRYTTPPERNTREWLDTFGKNPRMAVVDRIASDLSTVPGKLYRLDDETGEEVEVTQHPFLTMMQRPNPLYELTSAACWRLLQIYLEVKGEGYFLMEFDMMGRPVELWPLPTHWVEQTPYYGHPFYEIRTTGGLIRQIPVDDVFCMKDLNPLDPYKRGLGSAEALADEIETDEYAAKFQKKFFYNDATPATLISMPGSKPDQRKRFLEEWKSRFQGPFNSHGIATIDGEVTVTKLAENMRDMDMMEGRKFIRDAVLEHFGVPREIMGITENSNRATADAAQYIYAQNVLTPRLGRREEAINTQILPLFGPGLIWHFDDVIPRSQEFDKGLALDGWNAGLLTKDEARELLGKEPLESGGDVFKIQMTDVYINADDDPAEVVASLMEEPGGEWDDDLGTGGDGEGGDVLELVPEAASARLSLEHKDGDGPDEEKARLKNIANLLAAAQKEQRAKFEVATMKYFRKQGDRLKSSLEGGTKDDWTVWDILKPYIVDGDYVEDTGAWEALGDEGQKALVAEFVGSLIDWGGEKKILKDIFTPLWKSTYDKGAEIAVKIYGIRGVDRPELLSHAKLKGASRVVDINETTQKNIARIVANGIDAGISREQMTKEIMQEQEIQSKSRARLIADQETITTLETGHYEMMIKAGAKWKKWHHRPQKHPRENHIKLDGTRIAATERFNLGGGVTMRFPADPEATGDKKDIAKESIKCRCYVTYEFE